MSDPNVRVTVLDDGRTVATRYEESTISAGISIKVQAGSRYEVARSSLNEETRNYIRGAAHADEHMVCNGSVLHPERARDLIEGVPGYEEDVNSFTPATQFTCTNYDAWIPVAATRAVLDVMGDMLSQPLFRERDFEPEKKYILREWIGNQLSYNPSNFRNWVIPSVAYDGDSRFYPVIGDKESITQLSVSDVRDFHLHNVTTGRTVIGVTSNLPHDAIVEAVEKSVVLPQGARPRSEAPIYTGGDCRYWLPGDGGAHVVLAFKAPPDGDSPEGMGFKVASELLTAAKGKHSIPSLLSSDPLQIYNRNAYAAQMEDSGLLVVTFNDFEVRPALEAIQRTMIEMTERIDPEALARVWAKHEKLIEKAKKNGISASDMAGNIRMYGEIKPLDHFSQMILKVTEDQIKAAVRETLSHPPTFVAAGDLQPLPKPREVRDIFHVWKTADGSDRAATAVQAGRLVYA